MADDVMQTALSGGVGEGCDQVRIAPVEILEARIEGGVQQITRQPRSGRPGR